MSTIPDAMQPLKDVFGEMPGTDRFLFTREALYDWLFSIGGMSGRLHVETIGDSTEGRDILLAAISASETIAGLETIRDQRRATTNTDLLRDPALDHGRAAGEKVVVLITAGIHADEVGGVQLMPELVSELVTSNAPEVLNILERAIVLIVPTLNPDGMDLIHEWYTSTLGTSAEGTSPPALYHRFAGHDNNRDWYTHALQETRVIVDEVHRPWRPHVVLDLHQMGVNSPRYVLPPYLDPVEPHVHPLINSLTGSVGSFIASAHQRAGHPGVATGVMFDCYSPTRAYQHYHGGVRILAEAASARIATPVDINPTELSVRRGYDPRLLSVHNPMPWRGGTWRLRDIMDYHLTTIRALLQHVARHADHWLIDQWRILADEVRADAPTVHAIAPIRQQIDPASATELVRILQRGDVRLEIATERSGSISPETILVQPNQPFGSFARALLELTPYPETPTAPYDVTSHSLPLHMGVEVRSVAVHEVVQTRPLKDDDLLVFPAPTARDVDRARWLAIDPRSHVSIRVVNHALRNGADVRRLVRPHFDGGRVLQPGTWLIAGDHAMEAMSRARRACVRTWNIGPVEQGTTRQGAPSIGLYIPWVANAIDTGWLRLFLEQSGFAYDVVRDQELRAGGIGHLDVLLLGHQSPEDLTAGNSADTYPHQFAGGMGSEGVESLRRFAQQGGTIVAIDGASRELAKAFDLPVRFPLTALSQEEFACPGTVVKVIPDGAHPLMLGISEPFPVMLHGTGAFAPKSAWTQAEFPARFSDDPVISGWMRGSNYLKGLGAIADEPIGAGRLVSFAFRPHFRTQMLASYAPLLNAIMRAGQGTGHGTG